MAQIFLGLQPLASDASLKLHHVMSCHVFCLRNVSCPMVWLVRLCVLPQTMPGRTHARMPGPATMQKTLVFFVLRSKNPAASNLQRPKVPQHHLHHQHHPHQRDKPADPQARGCRPGTGPKTIPKTKQMMQVMLITFLFTHPRPHPRHAQGRRHHAAAPQGFALEPCSKGPRW